MSIRPALVGRRGMNTQGISKTGVWVGRGLSGLAVLFMSFDSIVKLVQAPVAVQGSAELGYTGSAVLVLGIIEAITIVLYLVPRTAVLGAVLFTAYFGGAVATHVSHGHPLFSHTLFPVYAAVVVWLGLWLRDPRVRAINPLARAAV